jgi:hypothetical protein
MQENEPVILLSIYGQFLFYARVKFLKKVTQIEVAPK